MMEKGERRRVHRLLFCSCLNLVTTILLLPVMTCIVITPDLEGKSLWEYRIDPCSNYTYNISCCSWEEVQCSDGTCVHGSVVCDNKPDCPDGSDELGCSSTSCDERKCDQLCQERKNATRCDCFGGYVLKRVDENKDACVDVDECKIGAHYCTHDCSNSNGTYTCTCRDGFQQQIEDDHIICKANDQNIMILYNSNSWIYSLSSQNRIVTPVVHSLHVSKMDIDPASDMVYWSSRHKVSRSFIIGAKNNTVSIGHPQIVRATRVFQAKTSIAIDWTAGNLYWITLNIFNVKQTQILVSKLDGRYVKTLVDNIIQASSIALDPESGQMYWTAGGPNPEIGSSWMNGNYRRTLVKLASNRRPTGLILDHLSNGKLFWIDSKENAIYSAFNDGTRVTKILSTSSAQFPVAMDVFENYIYWITKESRELVRHEKHGLRKTQTLLQNLTYATALKVYHKRKVDIDIRKDGLLCKDQCSHLCLHVPQGYSCSCPDGSKIQFLMGEILCDTEKIDQMEDPLDCKCSDKSKVCNTTSPYHKCHCNVTCDPTDTTTDDYTYDYTTDGTDESVEVTTSEVVEVRELHRESNSAYGTIIILTLCIIPIVICFILSFFRRPERQLCYEQTANRSIGFNAEEDSISSTFG